MTSRSRRAKVDVRITEKAIAAADAAIRAWHLAEALGRGLPLVVPVRAGAHTAPRRRGASTADPWRALEQPSGMVPLQALAQCGADGAYREAVVFPAVDEVDVRWVFSAHCDLEVMIDALRVQGEESIIDQNTDAAALRFGDRPLRINIGRVSVRAPIRIVFRAFGLPKDLPFLNLWFYGSRPQDTVGA